MIPKLLVGIAIAAFATGIALAMTKPWIEDVPELKTADFAREMNELIGAPKDAPDLAAFSALATKLRKANHEREMKFVEAFEAAHASESDGSRPPSAYNHPDFPTNAVMYIHEHPPRGVPAVRVHLADLEAHADLKQLQSLLAATPLPPRAWQDEPSVMEQLTARTISGATNYVTIRQLSAASRLAQLDGNITASLDPLDCILTLSKAAEKESLLVSFMVSRSHQQRVIDAIRLMALERTLDAPALDRAEAMLASIAHDDASWKKLTHQIVAAERLFGLATMREWLEEKKLNTKVNRRKVADATDAMHRQFIDEMLGTSTATAEDFDILAYISKIASEEEQSVEEILDGSRGMMLGMARTLHNSRAYLAAVRYLVAIEHFRLKHGKILATLDEIDASHFRAPHPARGTLTYRPDAASGMYTLYIFGSDGKDNGGKGRAAMITSIDEDCVLTEPRASKPADDND
jgi:hypothetical protein